MTLAIFVVSVVLLASFVLLVVIPTAARQTSVYKLHDTRDVLYSLARRHPEFRCSRFYRDVEFLLTTSIRFVRDQGVVDCIALLAAMSKMQDGNPEQVSEYKREIDETFGEEEKLEIIQKIAEMLDAVRRDLAWRIFWSHPVIYLVAVPLVGIAVLYQHVQKMIGGDKSSAIASTATSVSAARTIRRRVDSRSSLVPLFN